jgi:hypothetical protein
MKWQVEYTDTFGGQANYSWVERHVIDEVDNIDGRLTERALIRRAKALVGLNGVRGQSGWFGETYEFRPHNVCVVLFVYPIDLDE